MRTSAEGHIENDLRVVVNSSFSARYSGMKVTKAKLLALAFIYPSIFGRTVRG